MFRRAEPADDQPLSRDEVTGIIAMLMRIDGNTERIRELLEEDDGEADED